MRPPTISRSTAPARRTSRRQAPRRGGEARSNDERVPRECNLGTREGSSFYTPATMKAKRAAGRPCHAASTRQTTGSIFWRCTSRTSAGKQCALKIGLTRTQLNEIGSAGRRRSRYSADTLPISTGAAVDFGTKTEVSHEFSRAERRIRGLPAVDNTKPTLLLSVKPFFGYSALGETRACCRTYSV